MKKFYNYTEQLLLTVLPKSDSVGPVDHEVEEKGTDMFTTAADDIMKNLGVQPDEDVGEQGEIQSEGDSEGSGDVELECLGDKGLKVNFKGFEMTLPVEVVDAIKSYEKPDESEKHDEGETEEEHEEHEASETPEEEAAEHAEGESESEEDHDRMSESVMYVKKLMEAKKYKAVNPWAVCNASTGGKKKVGKEKFERCVQDVKAKHNIKKD